MEVEEMETNDKRGVVPPLWPYLVLCGVLALWVDFTDYHEQNTSDSIVPVLVSLYKWTPYFWECNRIGMLVPLLAIPFKNPLLNLVVQGWLVLFATFATFFMLARFVLRTSVWPLAGAVAAMLYVLLSTEGWRFVATFGQPHYAVALALGLAALLLAERRPDGRIAWLRLPAALFLMVLAHWVNSATTPILGPLVVLRGLLCRPEALTDGRRGFWWAAWRSIGGGETLVALAVLGAGAGGSLIFHLLVPATSDPMDRGFLPPQQWLAAWQELAAFTWKLAFSHHQEFYIAAASGGILWFLARRVRRGALPSLCAVAALVVAGCCYGFFMGTLQWVAANLFHPKYWIPVYFNILVALGIVVAALPATAMSLPRRRVLCAICVPALLLATVAAVGMPSRGRLRGCLDHMAHAVPLPQRTTELLESRITHVVGSYGNVWVGVFHANLVLHERREDRVIWGVSGRCTPSWDLWGRVAPEDLRIAAFTDHLNGEPELDAGGYLHQFFPPVALVEKRPTLWLLRASDEVVSDWVNGGGPYDGQPILQSWHTGFVQSWHSRVVPVKEWLETGVLLCASRTGKLTLTNLSGHPQGVTLDFDLLDAEAGRSHCCVEGPRFSDCLEVQGGTGHYCRALVLPPGKTTLHFACDARKWLAPAGELPVVFGVRNIQLREDAQLPRACSVVSPARGYQEMKNNSFSFGGSHERNDPRGKPVALKNILFPGCW
jgi:hypothetical protein